MNKKKGFTLIEMSLVLAGIIILTVISFFAYQKVQDRTRANLAFYEFLEFTTEAHATFPPHSRLKQPITFNILRDAGVLPENWARTGKNAWGNDLSFPAAGLWILDTATGKIRMNLGYSVPPGWPCVDFSKRVLDAKLYDMLWIHPHGYVDINDSMEELMEACKSESNSVVIRFRDN